MSNIDVNAPLPTLHDKEAEPKLPFGSKTGNVKLNLLGACVYYTNVNEPAPGSDIQNISANISLNVNYTYKQKKYVLLLLNITFIICFPELKRNPLLVGGFHHRVCIQSLKTEIQVIGLI